MKQAITILGAGSFGTAIAQLIAGNGYTVHLWDHDASHVKTLIADRENKKYLPGIRLHTNIKPISDLGESIGDVEWIFEAVPVLYLRDVLKQARPFAQSKQVWVVLSKGIESNTNMLPTQIIDDVIGADVQKAVLSGPNFAREIANHQISGASVAANDRALAIQLCQIIANDFMSVDITPDIIGVQVCGALKNVMSLGVGMIEGAGYGDNGKALFLTRGLSEMADFASAMGGSRETVYGLSGVGDLMLSSLCHTGRNRKFGERIGRGEKVEVAQKNGDTVEGLNTLKSVMQLAKLYNVHAPVCAGIEAVVSGTKSVKEMITGVISHAHHNSK